MGHGSMPRLPVPAVSGSLMVGFKIDGDDKLISRFSERFLRSPLKKYCSKLTHY
jgi:hypothetical protein